MRLITADLEADLMPAALHDEGWQMGRVCEAQHNEVYQDSAYFWQNMLESGTILLHFH